MMRSISWADRLIAVCDQGLRTVAAVPAANRPSPAAPVIEATLSAAERRESARLMRVNRAGEISAQALYTGQALFARDPQTAGHLRQAAAEEIDHLVWCTERLDELGGRPSILDPAWYVGSVAIGALAGLRGDATSLGFVVETERQVESHLDHHLEQLPAQDMKDRVVLEQMKADEVHHADVAKAAGGADLPAPIRLAMRLASKVMTGSVYWI